MEYYFQVERQKIEDNINEFCNYLSEHYDNDGSLYFSKSTFKYGETKRQVAFLLYGKPLSTNDCSELCNLNRTRSCQGAYGSYCSLIDRYKDRETRIHFNANVEKIFNYIPLYSQLSISSDVETVFKERYKFLKHFLAFNAKIEYDELSKKDKDFVDSRYKHIEVPDEPILDFEDYHKDPWVQWWKKKEQENIKKELTEIIGYDIKSLPTKTRTYKDNEEKHKNDII